MDFEIKYGSSGEINSVMLYGKELLGGGKSEIYINGLPFNVRKQSEYNDTVAMKGERFTDQFTGWALEISRQMGIRENAKHKCFGINYWIKRVKADNTYPESGPGDCVIESPLYVDYFSLLNLDWKFWDDDTRMVFSSSMAAGPTHEFGHCGYENDTPENSKKYMQNIWRRVYPSTMLIHGGLFYNAKTEEWIAVTCRKPHVGYILNIENAGRGVSYDFTLHSEFKMNEFLRMPEIKIYFGKTKAEMDEWLGDYISHYYEQPPEWVFKTAWRGGLSWDNAPSWKEQGEKYIEEINNNEYTGIMHSLVTNRPLKSGTLPIGYEPDPNHGTTREFKEMCLELKKRNIPFIVWMSHSGLCPGIYDDDWFMRGSDGQMTISWGKEPVGMYVVNPGHPGYREYTKKWIKFYIKECGAKGIFFDCMGWSFPCDFKKRDFMRYPGDTNIMGIKFMEEMYAYIKECDPEAIMMGEGASMEGPINIFCVMSNPERSVDGMGPREFIATLKTDKKFCIDQTAKYSPFTGMCVIKKEKEYEAHNKFIAEYLKKYGGSHAFEYVSKGVSRCNDMIFVSLDEGTDSCSFRLDNVSKLHEVITGEDITGKGGSFRNVKFGFYRMIK